MNWALKVKRRLDPYTPILTPDFWLTKMFFGFYSMMDPFRIMTHQEI